MALTVEDGTGLSGAETYGSTTEFQTYCDGRGRSITGVSVGDREAALRKAADFIDTFARYKGRRLKATQALEFPRDGLTDWGGYEITGVPALVKRACFDLAFHALTADLVENLERGGRVASESVGPISVSYEAGAPAGTVYQLAQKLLQQFLRDPQTGQLRTDGYTPPEGAVFRMGQMDAPGTDAVYSEE